MNFETIPRTLKRHCEFWNLGTIFMRLGTAMNFIIWILERHCESWNDIRETWNNVASLETILRILKRYEAWNSYEFYNMNFGTTPMESLEGLWILERYHESPNDTSKLETTLQASTLWILKRYYERYHEFWNLGILGTISMRLGTRRLETTLWILKLRTLERHYVIVEWCEKNERTMLLTFCLTDRSRKKKEKTLEVVWGNKVREIALAISYKNSLRCEILLEKFYTFFFMVIWNGRRKHLSE